jgi:PAS domain S-box-containing protein
LSVYPLTPGPDGRQPFGATVTRRLLVQLEQALEAFPLPVFSVDSDGVTVWQNATARATFGDLCGRQYDELIAPEELPATRERFARSMQGRPTQRARNVVRATSGELVPVEVTTTPLREEGRVVGVLGIAVPLPSRQEPPAGGIRLTPRQNDVLQLLAEGKSTNQIAQELHLSPVTVRNYISALLRALNAGSRLEAVLTALREGLVSLGPS